MKSRAQQDQQKKCKVESLAGLAWFGFFLVAKPPGSFAGAPAQTIGGPGSDKTRVGSIRFLGSLLAVSLVGAMTIEPRSSQQLRLKSGGLMSRREMKFRGRHCTPDRGLKTG
ncbi:hypothetical protein HDV57DRAFT_487705 [Trichoderma longibrachiatum]